MWFDSELIPCLVLLFCCKLYRISKQDPQLRGRRLLRTCMQEAWKSHQLAEASFSPPDEGLKIYRWDWQLSTMSRPSARTCNAPIRVTFCCQWELHLHFPLKFHKNTILSRIRLFVFYLNEPVDENAPHSFIDIRLMIHIVRRDTARALQ